MGRKGEVNSNSFLINWNTLFFLKKKKKKRKEKAIFIFKRVCLGLGRVVLGSSPSAAAGEGKGLFPEWW